MIGLATNAMTGCTGTFALAWLRSAEASDLFGVKHTRGPRVATRRAWLECRDLRRRVSVGGSVVTQSVTRPMANLRFAALTKPACR